MSLSDPQHPWRRMLLKLGAALSALTITGVAGLTVPSVSYAAALSKEERDKMTPDEVIESLKSGICVSVKAKCSSMTIWRKSVPVKRGSIRQR